MELLGINFGFLLIQLFNMLILASWLAFLIFPLSDLRKRKLTGTSLALWILIICAIPILGGLAYWFVVKPSIENI